MAIFVIVTDTNILINFMRAKCLPLLGGLGDYTFVVPIEVLEEITDSSQHHILEEAINQGMLNTAIVDDVEEIAIYTYLQDFMGRGEAACLALAEARGWCVASDEGRRLKREIIARLGDNRLFTTPGLLLLMIQKKIITIEQADEIKDILDQNGFRMKFVSFDELLASGSSTKS